MRLFFKSGGFTGILRGVHPELHVVYFPRIQGGEEVGRASSLAEWTRGRPIHPNKNKKLLKYPPTDKPKNIGARFRPYIPALFLGVVIIPKNVDWIKPSQLC